VLLASGARADADACLAAHERVQVAWHAGRLSEALEASVDCAQQACTQLVRGDCVRWNSELARNLPSLVLAVRDYAGHDLANARTFANGMLLAARSDGQSVALDPGAYRLRFEAPGFASAEQDLVVRIGEQLRRVEVKLVRIALTPRAEPAHRDDAAARVGPRVAKVSPASGTAIALAGSAAVTVLVGAGFGIRGLRGARRVQAASRQALR
jgi:hypothetical protein